MDMARCGGGGVDTAVRGLLKRPRTSTDGQPHPARRHPARHHRPPAAASASKALGSRSSRQAPCGSSAAAGQAESACGVVG